MGLSYVYAYGKSLTYNYEYGEGLTFFMNTEKSKYKLYTYILYTYIRNVDFLMNTI